jgi:PAS domain S-box-containing protein
VSAPLTDLGGWKVGAEDFLAAVLHAVAQPVWVVDPVGSIRFANPAAVAALAYDRLEELLGRDSHATIHHHRPDGRPYPAAECPMLLPRTTGETVSGELDWFFRRDGSMFPVSYVSVPIEMREGRGAVVAFTDIEERLRAEEVVRDRDALLAAQQSSLRRVATLVAGGAASGDVFAAVAQEVASVLELPLVVMSRFDPDERATVIGVWSDRPTPFQPGTRWPLDGPTVSERVFRTGRPVRIDAYESVPGRIAGAARQAGMAWGAGAPIIVDGRIWGAMVTASPQSEPLPERLEERLAEFTALVATALSTTQAREDLHRLAEEQAALRRVATLVAQGAGPVEVFAAVADEVSTVLDLPFVEMCRYEENETASVIAATGEHPFQPGTTWTLDGPSLTGQVWRTGRAASVEDYADVSGAIGDAARGGGVRSGVGAPIVVDGELWGVVSAGGDERVPLPPDAERRLSEFTDLVATALSNAQARQDLRVLADEQAALRRVATLVAEGAEPAEVFDAVCQETGQLMDATSVNLVCFTPEDLDLTMAGWSLRGNHVPPGTSYPLAGEVIDAIIRRTGAPARVDSYDDVQGELAATLRELGIQCEVGAPVVVGGEVWGALIASSDRPDRFAEASELRVASFAELIATAVANATARDELLASRARIVTAGDAARERLARDLHDGAQQRLVTALMSLQLADQQIATDVDGATRLLGEALGHTRAGLAQLRDLAAGVHPAILTNRGLSAAIEALADHSPLPVGIDVPAERFAQHVEVAAYFVAAEALTNVAKHAEAVKATVAVERREGLLVIAISDDGVGGANLDGHGLRGLDDRVQALGGSLRLESVPGHGTRVEATLPLSPP